MTKPENACVVACVSGVVGAVVSALSLNTGLGEQRVVLIVRAAIVLLGFAVAGGLLLLRPTRHRIVWGSVTLLNAFALAAVFGGLRT